MCCVGAAEATQGRFTHVSLVLHFPLAQRQRVTSYIDAGAEKSERLNVPFELYRRILNLHVSIFSPARKTQTYLKRQSERRSVSCRVLCTMARSCEAGDASAGLIFRIKVQK